MELYLGPIYRYRLYSSRKLSNSVKILSLSTKNRNVEKDITWKTCRDCVLVVSIPDTI